MITTHYFDDGCFALYSIATEGWQSRGEVEECKSGERRAAEKEQGALIRRYTIVHVHVCVCDCRTPENWLRS